MFKFDMAGIFSKKLDPRWASAVYFVLGQAGWFACVLGAARGRAYVGVAVVIALLALHLLRAERPLLELRLMAAVLLIGCVWENALIQFGLMEYPRTDGATAPVWILALWALFAAQFNTTYRWLKQRLVIAALLGAFAGPLSFHAGAKLGAVRFVEPAAATVALAIGWAVILPLISVLSRRWDGISETTQSPA